MSVHHDGITIVPVAFTGPPTSGQWDRGTLIIDAVNNIYKCTASGTPGTWTPLFAAAPPEDLIAAFPEFIDTFPNGIVPWSAESGTWISTHSGANSELYQLAPPNAGGRNGVVGVLAVDTGTNQAGYAGAVLGPDLLRFNSGPVYTLWARVTPTALASVAQDYRFRIGFIDTVDYTTEPVDGAYFEYQRSVSTNWLCKTATNNTRTVLASSAPVQNLTWIDLKIVVNGATGTATFYIDDVQVGQITTNVPTAVGRETSVGFIAIKTNGNQAFVVAIDRIYIKQTT